MLNRLRRISRRIGGWVTASKSAGKSTGKTAGKPAAKTAVKKPAVKPAAKSAGKTNAAGSEKAGASAKAVVKSSEKPAGKSAAKPAAARPAIKTSPKPAGKLGAQPPVKVAGKTVLKPAVNATPSSKLVGKSALPVAEKVPLKAAVTEKASAKSGKIEKAPGKMTGKAPASEADKKKGKPGKGKVQEMDEPALLEPDIDSDFEELGLTDANLAADLEAVEVEPVEVSPSAGLLAIMKPTSPDAEKSGEKKKKKDDLKIDRGGDLEAQWMQIKEKNKALKALPYKMSESFEARTPILHKVLGWGFIISNQNDRLEVLFQQGIKFLISNYKT